MEKEQIPSYEQELILAHILKKSREYVLAHADLSLSKAKKTKFRKLINRRKEHEPLAYILGHKEFYGLDFMVNKNTLIPRPETEHLVEEVLKSEPKNATILDVGTGSGNIIVSLAKNIEQRSKNDGLNKYFATDISAGAIKIAKENAKIHKVNKKIKFVKSNLLEYFINHCSLITGHFIIVANLPYLSKKIYNSTSPDVKNYEPKSALVSGYDGLDHYKKLFIQIKKIIDRCSLIVVHCFIEISPEQKTKIEKLAKKYFSKARVNFSKDLAGKWRVAKITTQ